MRVRCFPLAAGLLFVSSTAGATTGSEAAMTAKSDSPWRGSQVAYEHDVTVLSLDRGAELTYDPYYAHRLTLRPEYHVGDYAYASLRLGLLQELTNADDTTRKHEVLFTDLYLRVGERGLELPWGGIQVAADLTFALPTSKASAAATTILGLGPGVAVTRDFDVLAGLTIELDARFTGYFHRYTTVSLDAPWIPCGPSDSPACGSFAHTGERNGSTVLAVGPSVALAILDPLIFSASYTFKRTGLYGIADATSAGGFAASTHDAGDDVAARYSAIFNAEIAYNFMDELSGAFGVYTEYPELAPNSTYRAPFLNLYTELYLSVTFYFGPLIDRI